MAERFAQAFIGSTALLIGTIALIGCVFIGMFCMPAIPRIVNKIRQQIEPYVMTGTTCEELQAELGATIEMPSLTSSEVPKGDASFGDAEREPSDKPLDVRPLSDTISLSHFYGEDVITCFGDPAYYYTFWQQEIEDKALIAEFIYPETGLIFFSYSLTDWRGVLAKLTPQSEFQTLRRIPVTSELSELAPLLSHRLYVRKPVDPMLVIESVHEWQGWDELVLPEAQ